MNDTETAVVDKKSAAMEGTYLYCIIRADKPESYGHIGIGGRGDEVYTVNYKDLACVVSNSPETKYAVSRDNTLAHQRVLEEVMKGNTMLPVRFCTIANSDNGKADLEEKIREELLKERYDEFSELLAYLDDKVELGLKAAWMSMDAIYEEVVKENPPVKKLKSSLINKSPVKTHYERIKLGEVVKKAVDEKREKEGNVIFNGLKKHSVDTRRNKIFGDRMLLNAAFLIERSSQEEFDKEMERLGEKYDGRMKLKYVGPVPPYNFVEIVVKWGE